VNLRDKRAQLAKYKWSFQFLNHKLVDSSIENNAYSVSRGNSSLYKIAGSTAALSVGVLDDSSTDTYGRLKQKPKPK